MKSPNNRGGRNIDRDQCTSRSTYFQGRATFQAGEKSSGAGRRGEGLKGIRSREIKTIPEPRNKITFSAELYMEGGDIPSATEKDESELLWV